MSHSVGAWLRGNSFSYVVASFDWSFICLFCWFLFLFYWSLTQPRLVSNQELAGWCQSPCSGESLLDVPPPHFSRPRDMDSSFQLFRARGVPCRDSQPSLCCDHLEGASPKAKALILHAVRCLTTEFSWHKRPWGCWYVARSVNYRAAFHSLFWSNPL